MHTFEFDGKKLSDIGAIITEKPHYVLSVKELDFTALPGKSGDIVTDKKRFKNINISYKISSVPTFGSYSGSIMSDIFVKPFARTFPILWSTQEVSFRQR